MKAFADWLLAHEPQFRLAAFLSVFFLIALWELVATRRPLIRPRIRRWSANLLIVVINTVVYRLAIPIAALGVASIAEERGWGLLHWVELPTTVALIAAIILLDLGIYLQHLAMHAVPILWRLHRVHHADLDFDVTTGSRFHPIEILLSTGFKLALVFLIGPPVIGVLLFELLLNASSMFNHGNIRVPSSLDAFVRWFIVTPDMHRVHHSSTPTETNSNFGFCLPWWDRLFGTYIAQPERGHEGMTIGVQGLEAPRTDSLVFMLTLPFLEVGRESADTATSA